MCSSETIQSRGSNQSGNATLALFTAYCTLYMVVDTTTFQISVQMFVIIALLSCLTVYSMAMLCIDLENVSARWSNGDFKAAMRSWCCQQLENPGTIPADLHINCIATSSLTLYM